ncbi:MAG: hypothetical protein ACC645_13620 [Pirellulales bacterium]
MLRTSWSAHGARRLGICLTLLAAGVAGPSSAMAANKGYIQQPFEKDVVNRLRGDASKILSGQVPFNAASQNTLKKYYVNVFGEMTQVSAIGRFGVARQRFLFQLQSAKSPAALNFVNAFSLNATTSIARERKEGKNYHPAARINAVLIMADLDDKLSSGVGANATPPVPMAKALLKLVQLASDPKSPDGVKVAALLGLKRHARYGISGPQQASVADIVLALMNQKESPGNRSAEGHQWMRRLAIGIAGSLGVLGPENKTYQALAHVVADDTAAQSIRCAAAKALGQLDYTQVTDLDVTPAVSDLGTLAIVVLKHELDVAKRLADRANQQSAARGRSGLFGDEGLLDTAGAEEDNPAGVFPRRELAARIESVRTGLRALAARIPAENKKLVDVLVVPLDKLFGVLENRRSDKDQLVGAARTAMDQLAENLRTQQPESAEEGELLEGTDRAAGPPDEEARPDETGFYDRAACHYQATV